MVLYQLSYVGGASESSPGTGTAMRVAHSFRARLLGLAFRRSAAEPLLIPRCRSVHTAGMRFAIDVVFVDRQGFAVKIVRDLRPWRISLAAGARAVIEMPAGTLRWGLVLPGDRLYLSPASVTT